MARSAGRLPRGTHVAGARHLVFVDGVEGMGGRRDSESSDLWGLYWDTYGIVSRVFQPLEWIEKCIRL